MGFRRKFHGHPVVRLIVSVPVEVADEVDNLIGYPHCREFREGGTTTQGGIKSLWTHAKDRALVNFPYPQNTIL